MTDFSVYQLCKIDIDPPVESYVVIAEPGSPVKKSGHDAGEKERVYNRTYKTIV